MTEMFMMNIDTTPICIQCNLTKYFFFCGLQRLSFSAGN